MNWIKVMAPKTTLTSTMKRETKSRKRRKKGRKEKRVGFCEMGFKPIPPRLFSNLFPLGGGRHVSHPVELHTKIFLHQNFSLRGLRVSIADFGFEGPGFDSQ